MHQDSRRSASAFSREATEAGGLNFVYDAIAEDMWRQNLEYFGLTFCARGTGLSRQHARHLREHSDMSYLRHYPRIASAVRNAEFENIDESNRALAY